MTERKIEDEPSKVETSDDAVIVTGPDGVHVAMTARAALETAKRLGDAAVNSLVEQANKKSE